MPIKRFTVSDTSFLLIDHQKGTMSWARSSPFDEIKKYAIALAKAAKALDMPLVLTTSMEDHAQGPLLDELAQIAPAEYERRIRRSGVVNALEDPAFAAAVKATGKHNIIIAGVTNDVCTVYPTLSLLTEGYNVQVVADAGGSMTKAQDEIALRTMERAGADITATNQVLTQLVSSWVSPAGQKLMPVLLELIPQ